MDDDLDICCSIKAHMKDVNMEICCIASASEVIGRLMNQNYCLVILSLQLLKINGMELLRSIRLTKGIPILVLTTRLSSEDKVSIFQGGADAIIEKPVNIKVCAAQAEALIQRYLFRSRIHKRLSKV